MTLAQRVERNTMYTKTNFKTKRELKEAVASNKVVTVFQPNDVFGNPKAAPTFTGSVCLEGPHYPKPHSWYATAEVERGVIVKVK